MGRRPGFNFWSFPMSALFSPTALVVPFENLRMTDVEAVGGKNASLGEMISHLPQGVRVPTGFATTAHAFREFLALAAWHDKINARWHALDTDDVRALAQVGAEIRAMVEAQPFPADLEQAIRDEFARPCRPATRGQLCGALVRHGRRPARRLFCRASRRRF
jgi:pyruvate,water dikinase